MNPCGTGKDEPLTVNDYTEVRLTLTAPINAGSFTFDFNFFSEEYPEYVCHGFNDTFLAMLTSQQYTTPFQIAFDGNGHRINVNNSFFQDCTSIVTADNLGYTHACSGALSLLTKTGYEIKYGADLVHARKRQQGLGRDGLAQDDRADPTGGDLHAELHRLRPRRRLDGLGDQHRQLPLELDHAVEPGHGEVM